MLFRHTKTSETIYELAYVWLAVPFPHQAKTTARSYIFSEVTYKFFPNHGKKASKSASFIAKL